jgi:hypothetical protein
VLSAADIAKQFIEMESSLKQAVAAAAERGSQMLTEIQYLQDEAKMTKELYNAAAGAKEAVAKECSGPVS